MEIKKTARVSCDRQLLDSTDCRALFIVDRRTTFSRMSRRDEIVCATLRGKVDADRPLTPPG